MLLRHTASENTQEPPERPWEGIWEIRGLLFKAASMLATYVAEAAFEHRLWLRHYREILSAKLSRRHSSHRGILKQGTLPRRCEHGGVGFNILRRHCLRAKSELELGPNFRAR